LAPCDVGDCGRSPGHSIRQRAGAVEQGLIVTTIRVFNDFAEIPLEIGEQLGYANQPNFFLSIDWFELLFESCLRPDVGLRLYVVLEANSVLGALVCGVRHETPRTLVSLTNFYTLEFGPALARTSDAQAVCRRLADHIASERPRWDAVHLSLLAGDAPQSQFVHERLQANGFRVHRFFQYENWFATCSGESFNSYYARRPSQLRNTIARRQKKLEKAHRFEIRVVRDPGPDLERVVSEFISVYGSSWKQQEPYPEFIPAFARRAAALRILRLGVLYVDGAAAAAQFWIAAQRRATIYKLAYDEKFTEFGVGSILSREMFRVAIDEDLVETIDYGIGSEAYKKDWMSSVRQIGGLQAFNLRTPAGLYRSTAEAAKDMFKRFRKTKGRDSESAAS
jgi:hypothetical protein